jgi:tripartite ATP-independent transporter DctP family solute receptor
MHIERRTLIRSAAAGVLAAPAILRWGTANAAQFTIRMGIDAPPTEPTVIECNAAGEKIKTRTNGAVEFSMFPSSALGAGTDMIAPVRSGAVEGYFFTSAVIAVIAPNAAISGIPLAFKDYPTAWAALDGDLGNRIKSEIRGAGLEPMTKVFDIGFRQIATQKRIDKVEDLAGIKLRVPQSPLYVGLFRTLGVLPATMSFADVYPALQTKVVEGMEGPILGIYNSKMYEVTKFIAITYHMWDGFWLTINPVFWNKLSEQQRDIITEELSVAAGRMRENIVKAEEKAQSDLKGKGMTITNPDMAGFRKKLVDAGFYKEWKGKFKPEMWAALEQASGQSL